ncbi:MAG: hypothetical protein FWE54_00460 [Methanimicrococcus sp.]|nr:hypothetical protein [Methanimicrococcus sp.]
MEKLSRDKLDIALDSLKKLRKESAYRGHIPDKMACCYGPIFSAQYRINHVPGEYVCPNCGKCFGSGRIKDAVTDEQKFQISVSKMDFDEIFNAYNKCIKVGFDVVLELQCSECRLKEFEPFSAKRFLEEYELVSAVFRFRGSEEEEYTVSYPQMRSEDLGEDKALSSEKHFYPWQYTLAIAFLTDVIAIENGTKPDEACRKWLDNIANSILYEGKPWSIVDESIKGILGLSLKRTV